MSDEQCRVVTASARAGLTVVSGGPGTGKTSIVVAIMRLMVRLGIDPSQIVLTAPTGKAAYRMGECVNESLSRIEQRDAVDQALLDAHIEPATIHRILGYSPDSGRFRHHRNNPLSAKVIIVDEGSMLDVTLMERLTNAIQAGARLILLGDANQLPSVAAGSVLRALVPSAEDRIGPLAAASMRLEVNHRMNSDDAAGRSILLAARAINDGDTDLLTRLTKRTLRSSCHAHHPTSWRLPAWNFLRPHRESSARCWIAGTSIECKGELRLPSQSNISTSSASADSTTPTARACAFFLRTPQNHESCA